MIRERIGQAALRAYPPAVRRTRGAEMMGMLLDAGEQSRLAFVRESGSLLLGGLREREALAARAGTRRLVADACCQAVPILLTLWLISALDTQGISGTSRQLLVRGVVPAAILGCALVGYERIAAVGGLAALVVFGPLGPPIQLMPLTAVLAPIACLLVMAFAPRERPRDLRRLLWLAPVAVLAALDAHGYVGLAEVLLLVSAGGLLRLLLDPRLAFACGLVWITLLAHAYRPGTVGVSAFATSVAIAAGFMLTVAAGRLWIMGRSATS